MENSPDAVTIINEDGTIRYESPSYERLLGVKPEDRLGNNLFERIHPDDITRAAELFAGFLQNRGGTLRAEVRVKHNDGSWRFIDAIGSNLLDNPIVKGIFVNLRDITERKKAEEALHESEEKYRLHFENVSDVIFSYDREFRILSMSPSVKHMLGYSPEELIGKRFTDLNILAPECLELALSSALRTLAGERVGFSEYIFIAKDGSRKCGELGQASPLFADGKVVAVLSVGRDITERKHMEEALQTSERQYRLLAENVKDVIWTVDMNLRLTYTSPSITQLTGYRREEYMTKTLDEILTPACVEFVTNLFAEELALEDGGHRDLFRARTFEAELICKDGSKVPVEMKASGLRDADGRPIGLLGVSRDISDRKLAEQALRQREQDYSLLLESTQDCIIVFDAETLKVIFGNRRADLMFGFDPILHDGIGVNLLDFVHPEPSAAEF
jgi:PAS domain S-box-containing protein